MGRILIVDDEKSIRTTFKAFLVREGHTVFTACNVNIAIEVLESNEIDLVLTDIIMPKITGMDLLVFIKEQNPDIPVIIMTGEPTVDTATLAVQGGAKDYLTKPVAKETLIKVVKYAIEQREILESKRILERENKEYRDNLENLVRIRTLSLQKAMSATVRTMSSVVELRDPYTAGHETKVGNLAVAIGEKMNLPKRQIDCLYVAGYLHDIGKISTPAEILSKPGKLIDIEFEIIKTHVMYGNSVLKKVELPWPVAEVVHQHHERIDGTGYPRGLTGDKIIIEAKIIAVADVIEAMNSHRPYRPSLGLEAALDEIQSNIGIKYDEDVANAALALFNDDNYQIVDEPRDIVFDL